MQMINVIENHPDTKELLHSSLIARNYQRNNEELSVRENEHTTYAE